VLETGEIYTIPGRKRAQSLLRWVVVAELRLTCPEKSLSEGAVAAGRVTRIVGVRDEPSLAQFGDDEVDEIGQRVGADDLLHVEAVDADRLVPVLQVVDDLLGVPTIVGEVVPSPQNSATSRTVHSRSGWALVNAFIVP